MKAQIMDDNGNLLALIPLLGPRTFSTGSRGYSGQGKSQIGDAAYQIGINMTEVGSNPNKPPKTVDATPKPTVKTGPTVNNQPVGKSGRVIPASSVAGPQSTNAKR